MSIVHFFWLHIDRSHVYKTTVRETGTILMVSPHAGLRTGAGALQVLVISTIPPHVLMIATTATGTNHNPAPTPLASADPQTTSLPDWDFWPGKTCEHYA